MFKSNQLQRHLFLAPHSANKIDIHLDFDASLRWFLETGLNCYHGFSLLPSRSRSSLCGVYITQASWRKKRPYSFPESSLESISTWKYGYLFLWDLADHFPITLGQIRDLHEKLLTPGLGLKRDGMLVQETWSEKRSLERSGERGRGRLSFGAQIGHGSVLDRAARCAHIRAGQIVEAM